jgi:DegV family protein with EDD domain
MKIAYVIDSTIDVEDKFIEENDVHVVPLSIIWGEETFLDKQELSSKDFFERLETTTIHPRSSAPSPADFLKIYKKIVDEYDHVISLHISSRLSGTISAAMMSASMVDRKKIHIFDSRTLSIVGGLLLKKIDKYIHENNDINELDAFIEKTVSKMDMFFVVDSLDYLYKGGRIGKAKQFIGKLLDIKPVLSVVNGEVTNTGKIYGEKDIYKYVDKYFHKCKKENRKLENIYLAYSNDINKIDQIESIANYHYPSINCYKTYVSPVVGCHVGPGLIGVAVS